MRLNWQEEFRPLDLAAGEQFSGRKILKIFMICYHINWGWRSLEVMTPDFECFKNCEQFFVMVIVVEFGWGKSLGVKGDRMNFTVGQRYGGKDSSEGIVRCVHFNDKREPGIQWAKFSTVVKASFSNMKVEQHLLEKSQAVPL